MWPSSNTALSNQSLRNRLRPLLLPIMQVYSSRGRMGRRGEETRLLKEPHRTTKRSSPSRLPDLATASLPWIMNVSQVQLTRTFSGSVKRWILSHYWRPQGVTYMAPSLASYPLIQIDNSSRHLELSDSLTGMQQWTQSWNCRTLDASAVLCTLQKCVITKAQLWVKTVKH